MTEIFFAAAVCAIFIILKAAIKNGVDVALAVAGDEDIKIAPGSFSPCLDDASDSNAAAQAYLKQKCVGNIDKARDLGESYANLLYNRAKEYLHENHSEPQKLQAHHKLLLISYVVNRVITDLSPNSILAQTALNVFYDSIDEKMPEINEHVRDMSAFSLYILCERSAACVEDEIGIIYAQVCGKEGDSALIGEGNRLYREAYSECVRLHDLAGYKDV